jgi:hypothetical protein
MVEFEFLIPQRPLSLQGNLLIKEEKREDGEAGKSHLNDSNHPKQRNESGRCKHLSSEASIHFGKKPRVTIEHKTHSSDEQTAKDR